MFFSPPTTLPSLAPITGIGFNLDNRFPAAQNLANGVLSGNFFASETIVLNHGDTQTLLLYAVTKSQYCQFYFRLIADTVAGRVTELITDNGKPFEATAETKLGYYKTLYVGDKQVNATTFSQEVL